MPSVTTLLDLAGFAAGAALYAMLGIMTTTAGVRDSRSTSSRPVDGLLMAMAVAGVCWNAGALVLFVRRDLFDASLTDRTLVPTAPAWLSVLAIVAFSALGLLPAFAVQAAARPLHRPLRTALAVAAYGVSLVAAAVHVTAALRGAAVPSAMALLVLTVGFAALLPVLAFALWRVPGTRTPLLSAALASFAVLALHLRNHSTAESPALHLLGDHTSVLLALLVLYQDYRVAFADVFLKRTVTGVVLAGGALSAHLLIVPVVLPRLVANHADPAGTALIAAVFIGALAAAPVVRRHVDQLIDRWVLQRPDFQAVRQTLATAVARAASADAVLDVVAEHLTPALLANGIDWHAVPATDPDATSHATSPALVHVATGGRDAHLTVPTADAPSYAMHIRALRGGRRLLSDDLALLEWTALLAARRIDVLRVAHERFARDARELEALRLATEAELRALRAQLNPHFLFNALTTVAYLVQVAPDRALATLYELTGLLRAVLRSPTEAVPLGDELAIVEAYLAIERARFEERLRVIMDVDDAARSVAIPPLLIQPLVENAVKHGVAPLRHGATVTIRIRLEGATGAERVRVRVHDTGAGVDASAVRRALDGDDSACSGLGLASVARRLERRYGAHATFAFDATPGAGATVEFSLPLVQSS